MEENEEILKPCPFCGAKAFVGIESMSSYWSIGCTECFCHFDRYFETKEIAIKVWNIRL